ncbi:MAG: aminodeoxychorismate synthase component I [Oceanicoccus sp.]
MSQLVIEELPYAVDSAPLFETLLDLELPVYLDSARPYSARGRYDIFSAAPVEIVSNNSLLSNTYDGKLNLFNRLDNTLKELIPRIDNDYHLPFVGGALGYFGYDLGRQLEQLPQLAEKDLQIADTCAGIYSWAVIVDHRQQRALLVAHPCVDKALLNDVRSRLHSSKDRPATPFQLNSLFQSNMSREYYNRAFEKVQQYIVAGDCYQINLAQRFSANYEGDPWQAYLLLREAAAAPFSGYIQMPSNSILSLSPERFLHTSNHRVSTSPIKGTIARGTDRTSDMALAAQLLSSSKDRAENLMIVDLLRNDLGKSCIPGSIQVDELFQLQSFQTVHHLVSTISGQLLDHIEPIDLLARCFPGGSITGAPKVRAMEIIEELEPCRRSVYCGSLGYISCDGQMDTNIAIRTMVCEDQKIHCWAGGGIVADSDCDSEYKECMTKVGKLLAALES